MRISLVAALLVCAVAGCADGGSTRASRPLPAPTGFPSAVPAPNPTPTPAPARAYQTRFIISLSGGRSLQVVPSTGRFVAPPGGSVGTAVAGAVVTYPDGTRQLADAAGGFVPARSTYALARQALLQTSPEAQPLVIIADPAGSAKPVAAHVDAYGRATVATAKRSRAVMTRKLQPKNAAAISGGVNLAGVRTLPDVQFVNAGDQIIFDVEGSDVQGNVVALDSAQIVWTTQNAQATLVPVQGTNEAVYFAPPIAGGVAVDVVKAAVVVPGSPLVFDATSQVTAIGTQSAAALSGTARTGGGAPIASGVAMLVQNNVPKGFGPNYWLGTTDLNGAYAQRVPANTPFTPILGVPALLSPDGAFGFFVASAGGSPAVTSGAAGTTTTADLILDPSAARYVANASSDSLPSAVGNVRDAWYATTGDATSGLFQPDSGLQPLLAAPPAGPLPYPAQPALVGSGAYASYCYQWETIDGSTALVVIENRGTSCAAGGNTAVVITPQPGANTFSFARYINVVTYALASPLDPVPPSAAVVAAGSWQQAATTANGTIVSDDVVAQYGVYDLAHQDLASPLFDETLRFHVDRNPAGLTATTIQSDTLAAHDTGNLVSSYAGTRTEIATCSGSSSTICLTINGQLTRSYTTDSGPFTRAFTIDAKKAGDGSGQFTYQSATSGDLGRVFIPIVDAATGAAQGCRVCASQPGSVFDVDGSRVVSNFTVTTAGLVRLNLIDETGATIDALTFVL